MFIFSFETKPFCLGSLLENEKYEPEVKPDGKITSTSTIEFYPSKCSEYLFPIHREHTRRHKLMRSSPKVSYNTHCPLTRNNAIMVFKCEVFQPALVRPMTKEVTLYHVGKIMILLYSYNHYIKLHN